MDWANLSPFFLFQTFSLAILFDTPVSSVTVNSFFLFTLLKLIIVGSFAFFFPLSWEVLICLALLVANLCPETLCSECPFCFFSVFG